MSQCPHCGQELPVKICPQCSTETPEESVYCIKCGSFLEQKEPVETTKSTNFGDDSWENRKLCSDGSCIGVIGQNGRCKVCGKPYDPNAGD